MGAECSYPTRLDGVFTRYHRVLLFCVQPNEVAPTEDSSTLKSVRVEKMSFSLMSKQKYYEIDSTFC